MATINGTSGNDTLQGTEEEDTIYGYDGNDVLYTGTGDHTDAPRNYLYGGNGNDTFYIYGSSGGSGGNNLYGDSGDDLFIWDESSWKGNIYDSSGNYDTIYFTGGLTLSDLVIQTYGNDLRITPPTNNSYAVLKGHMTSNTIDRITFDDGSIYSLNGSTTSLIASTDIDDVVYLSAAADIFDSGIGDDTVYGMAGDDTLEGGFGTDTINFSLASGAITANLGAGTATGEGNDTISGFENIVGSDYNDTLTGDGLGNRIDGGAGDDTIKGNAGIDILNGDAGNDTIYASARATINGGNQNDTVYFDYDNSNGYGITVNLSTGELSNSNGATGSITNVENVYATHYDDDISGNSADNILFGDYGDDTISGGGGNDDIQGGVGTDTLYGGGGDDVIAGHTEDDTIYGDAGNDILHGDVGNDTIYGGADNDILYGYEGDDFLMGGAGRDDIFGNEGTDTVSFADATQTVKVNLGNNWTENDGFGNAEWLKDVENVIGSAQSDHLFGSDVANELYGNDGDDYLFGKGGADYIYSGDGKDTIDGGTGRDTASFEDGAQSVIINLSNNWVANDGYGNGEKIRSIEILLGSDQGDNFTGDSSNNEFYGNGGNDILFGGWGRDTLDGGEGADILKGGAGSDTFVFSVMDGQSDQIKDFSLSDNDILDLSDILSGFDAGSDDITQFIEITESTYHSYLAVDVDGGGNNFVQIAEMRNVTGLTDEQALLDSGNIVV